jgi:hypothetical protein
MKYQAKRRKVVEARVAVARETVQSANGPQVAEPGDYIIMASTPSGGVDHYPVKPEVFLDTYEALTPT